MTKFLLDPVLTADPSKCSTTIQYHEFVKRMLTQREDVFFYWMVPNYVTEEQMDFYPKDPRVTFIRYEATKDRIREYITLSDEFAEILAFNGTHWDFDILVTVRAGLVPLMRQHMNSSRMKGMVWMKQVWIIENMPMMMFKTTVPTIIPEVQERMVLEGHLAADKSFVCSYHEKPEMIQAAKKYFAPTLVRQLDAKLKNIVTAQFEHYNLKPKEKWYKKGRDTFGLAYIGRMEKANNIVDINDIMLKTWVTRGDRVKLLLCTVSEVVPVFDTELIDVRQPKREEFWKIVQEEMHAFIKMPNGGGFSLSLIEPIMLGTPVLAVRSKAYESLLGQNYPFFANGPTQMAGLIKALYDDYDLCYEKFTVWFNEWFKPTYAKRMSEDLLYDLMERALIEYEESVTVNTEAYGTFYKNETVVALSNLIGTHPEGAEQPLRTMFDALRHMAATTDNKLLAEKTEPDDRLRRTMTFSTPWHPYKMALKKFFGFKDASTVVGHMEKA